MLVLLLILLVIILLNCQIWTYLTGGDGTKDVEIIIPSKYISNFWRNLEIPLNNCKINLILNWSKNCFYSSNMLKIKQKPLQ